MSDCQAALSKAPALSLLYNIFSWAILYISIIGDAYHSDLVKKFREALKDVEKVKESLQDMSNDRSADPFDQDESVGGKKRKHNKSENYNTPENDEEEKEYDEEGKFHYPI